MSGSGFKTRQVLDASQVVCNCSTRCRQNGVLRFPAFSHSTTRSRRKHVLRLKPDSAHCWFCFCVVSSASPSKRRAAEWTLNSQRLVSFCTSLSKITNAVRKTDSMPAFDRVAVDHVSNAVLSPIRWWPGQTNDLPIANCFQSFLPHVRFKASSWIRPSFLISSSSCLLHLLLGRPLVLLN